MQVIARQAGVRPAELARDVFALVTYLLRSSAQDQLRALGETDLSITQLKLLHVLDHAADELALTQLGERLGLSLPAASRAIECLHQRGYVARREDFLDRRIKRVAITRAGRDVVGRLAEIRLTHLQRFAGTLTERERRRLAAALAPIIARDDVGACRPKGRRR